MWLFFIISGSKRNKGLNQIYSSWNQEPATLPVLISLLKALKAYHLTFGFSDFVDWELLPAY